MNITIVGTGLIGASLGLALRKLGNTICGTDLNAQHLEQSISSGAIHFAAENMEQALENADITILCIPVDSVLTILPDVLNNIKPNSVVMDMGSTKLDICETVKSHPNRKNFVAAHPMAGVEHSGPLAAHVDLFINAKVIICEAQRSSSQALNTVLGLLQEIKMKVIFMDADEHDRQLALVSHLPQFIAYALASMNDFDQNLNNQWVELGGGGLQSSIRLGKSDAEMWMPIFQQNKINLLQYIDKYINQLQGLKQLVEDDKRSDLHQKIKIANSHYENLNYKNNQAQKPVEIQSTPRFFYS